MIIKIELHSPGLNGSHLLLRAEDTEGKLLQQTTWPIERLACHDPLCRSSVQSAVAATLQLLQDLNKQRGWARELHRPMRVEWEPARTSQPATTNPQPA